MKKILMLIMAVAMCAAILTGCGSSKTEVDLSSYMSVSFEGLDGEGTAAASFDFASFEGAIMSKWEGDLATLTMFEATMNITLDSEEGLTNGDKVTATITFGEEEAKECGLSLDNATATFDVTGLTEPIEVDPFDSAVFNTESGVSITFEGTSPYAEVNLENKCLESQPQHLVQYTVDKEYSIANDDVITITATLSQNAIDEGYVLTAEKTDLTVEGLDYYIANLSELTDSDRAIVEEKLREVFDTKAENYINFITEDGGQSDFLDFRDKCTNFIFTEGYDSVIDQSFGEVKTIIPFTLDINNMEFYWWDNVYYEDILVKSFADVSGYFEVSGLKVDSDGKLISGDSVVIDVGYLYQSKTNFDETIYERYGLQ